MGDDRSGGDAGEQSGASGAARRQTGSLISMRPLPLAFKRGEGRMSLRRKLVHMWRYGLYHPDEDLLGVIDAAADSLVTQIMAAEAVLTGSRLAQLQEIRSELDAELADAVPELAVLLGIEAKINALYPPAMQRRRAWMIEERFQRVAPGQAADYWAADRVEADLNEERGDRIRRSDDAVARATARQTAAASAAAEADAAFQSAETAYAEARGAVSGDDEAVNPRLDRLAELRCSAPEDDSERAALEQEVGPLLDARDARDSATVARDSAAADRARADRALEAAKLDRELVTARCDLAAAEARLRGVERAARETQSGSSGADGQKLVETARGEVAAARTRADAAAAAVEVHAAALPEGAAEADAGGEDEAEAAGGSAPAGEAGGSGTVAAPGAAGGSGGGGRIPPDADAHTLLGYIHNSYLMGIAREKAVRDLMRWLMMRFWTANLFLVAGLFVIWGAIELASRQFENLLALVVGLFFLAAVGRIGATMSVVQRLQRAVASNVLARDPILELTRLRTGKNGINLALFSGGVFALLMYAFIASGIPALIGLDEGLAPTLARVEQQERRQARAEALNSELSQAALRVADAQRRLEEAEEARDAADGAAEGNPPADGNATGTGAPTTTSGDSEALLGTARQELAQATANLNDVLARRQAAASAADAEQAQAAPAASGGTKLRLAVPDRPMTREQLIARRQAEALHAAERRRLLAEQAEHRNGLLHHVRDFFLGTPDPEGRAERDRQEEHQAQCKATEACDPFRQLSDALGLAGRLDFFKLLIWAFLAGFAERLVPDVLDSIANRGARRRRRQDEGEDPA
jgi:hypothetical protein